MGVRAAAAVGQSAADRNLGSRGTMTAAVTGRSGQGQVSVKLILIGAAILLSVGMGIRQSLGLFLTPLATQGILAHEPWQIGALFFLALALVMLPAGFWAGGADLMPGRGAGRTSMREMLGQAMRHRPFLVMSGAYFVCGLNLVFLTTHLPTYLAICGQDPMLSAEALAVIGGMNCVGSLAAGWLGARYPT